MKTNWWTGIVVVGCVLALSSTAEAAITGPEYPAPGGNNWSSDSGSPVSAGGVTFSYSNFDPSAFTDLYWGAWDNTTTSATLDGELDNLTFYDVAGNKAIWRGTTTWYDHTTGTTYTNVSIQLEITISGTGSWVSAADLGLTGRTDYLWDTSQGEDFSANFLFSADVPGDTYSYKPLSEIETGGEGKTLVNFSGGFFSTSAVPEPASLILWSLLGGGTIGQCWLRRRKGV